MPIEITVPRLGWTMEEGTFVGWLKKDGDPVRAGEPLFTLDGDKALQEIEAPETGILRIPPDAPSAGSTVRVGQLLGYLVTTNDPSVVAADVSPLQIKSETLENHSGLTSAATGSGVLGQALVRANEPGVVTKAPATAATERDIPATPINQIPSTPRVEPQAPVVPLVVQRDRQAITPRARRKATELGVNWTNLRGTGRGGRIRESDIVAAQGVSSGPVQTGKVAITDWTFPDLTIELAILRPLGHETLARQCKTEAELISLVAEADCVITQFARVNANVIAAMKRARAIVRYGIGVDNVDLEAARAAGIAVCNVPDYCTHEVADQTLAFILGLTRQVVAHTNHVRGGKWGLAVPLTEMRTLKHLTVGVVGFGRIGREVVRRLVPFQCRLLVFDPVVASKTISDAGAIAASFDDVLVNADMLTLHCPSTSQTRKMLSPKTLARMKRGALLINVARGDLVDTEALVDALSSGQLGGAALDVCECEPIPAGHPLLRLPSVILAPHIASASPTAVRQLRETVAHLAATALSGKLPSNVVNGVTASRQITKSHI